MADYKELLRRAVEALPENNGAARRAVYEKARAALVGQLRAINPPLPARDITTHRLQLEDCIRQVEQEASEAVIAGISGPVEPPPAPVYFEPPKTSRPEPAKPRLQQATKSPTGKQPPAREPPKALPQGGSIEDIIAAANAEPPAESRPARARPERGAAKPIPMRLARPASQQPEAEPDPEAEETEVPASPQPAARPAGRQLPSIVARAEAAKSRSTAFGAPGGGKPYDAPRRGPVIEPRTGGGLAAAARGQQVALAARQQVADPDFDEQPQPQIAAAMSAVREVEVEDPPAVDPQHAIDRAIATLDREARGEGARHDDAANDVAPHIDEARVAPAGNGKSKGLGAMLKPGKRPAAAAAPAARAARPAKPGKAARESLMPTARRGRVDTAEAAFPRARAENEGGGMSAITIFLIVFGVLVAGAGGAGYWAVSQGYLDVPSVFGAASPAPAETTGPAVTATAEATPDTTPATGPGNTAAPAAAPEPATELAAVDDRLVPEASLSGQPMALTASPAGEERLGATNADDAATAEAAVAALDPAAIAGSQSLLLEASDDGTTGAVPFSGTVEWSRGTDETGLPTLVGKANIPARNLGVEVLIRKNSDPSLPASHLMEINFEVSDTFVGGSVAGLPGVLLKNEELVQGTPLVGASARVVGNSFLFAMSASPQDMSNNSSLLTTRKWIDLALIYATGKRAIITLEKDSAAETLFAEVFDTWSQTASN